MWVLFKHFIIEYRYCKIPRNTPLNEHGKGQISANKLEGKSISFIARELSRSRTAVRNYLKDPESYDTRKRPGHPPKITNAVRHWPFLETSKEQSSSRNLQKFQNLPITPRRVRQLLHESLNLVYRYKKRYNLWGIFSRRVYKNKRQFKDRETLKSCIKQMKFHLKLSENLLIQSKTSVLKYYNWKGMNIYIEFCTILLLNTNFQNCFILKNIFFLITFSGGKLL